ncbi:MAG: hypothetical protein EOO27_06090 [Comamonadaceae bacterium]|nr:MAG: hypothetical protein EOO27_06090 [Comamonadaceae bacterium]
MLIPQWIGGPAVIALSAVDAALQVQARAVGALTRAVIRGTGTLLPGQSCDSSGANNAFSQFVWLLPEDNEEEREECGDHGSRFHAPCPARPGWI